MDNEIISQYNQYQDMLDNYASIVEKTNQHLSMWVNPYGIMVGVLTLIVAIMAVVVAWYIWKNSKEQKELFKETLQSYQETLEVQAKILMQQKQGEMDEIIERLKKSQNSIDVQNLIQELKEKSSRIPLRFMCRKCGNLFNHSKVYSGHERISCPRCGEENVFSENDSL